MKWAENYALKVSEIIDDPKNKEIRDLIVIHEYKQACELIIPMLFTEGEHALAA